MSIKAYLYPKEMLCINCAWANWEVQPLFNEYDRIIDFQLVCFCWKQYRYVRKLVKECKKFLDKHTRTLFNGMLVTVHVRVRTYEEAVKELERRLSEKMPKIGAKLPEYSEPEEGRTYLIEKVEVVSTEVRGFKGARVTLRDIKNKDDIRVTMLWARDVAGRNSKLGAFLYAFSEFFKGTDKENDYDDTDNWIGHQIKVIKWKERNREIVVVK